MDHAHLRPEMRDLAMLPATERLALAPVHRWIGYTCAAQILGRLEDMLTCEPGRVRPRCMLVIGPTNNGKTAIAERFLHGHSQHASANGEHEVIPVLSMQMPPSPTPARLWASILHSLGVPLFLRGRSSPDREVFALRLLRTVGCRTVMIDELHNLLDAPAQRQRELLSVLRFLTNELRIPLVCLGTREAWLAVRSDDQLENRFEPFLLPPWQNDREFGRLLASFESVLPLREPSGLGTPAIRARVLCRAGGTIGEITALLAAAAAAALRSGREHIGLAEIETADYQPPATRRRLFEAALR
jgi:hypothetical protein